MFGAILTATNSSFQKSLTFCRSMYVKKVMKLLAFIFEQPSYVQELPKAQPAVVLVLKRLRRRGNHLKSHPTDWEKPGIEPATPGLQDIGLSPTPRRLLYAEIDSALVDRYFYDIGCKY